MSSTLFAAIGLLTPVHSFWRRMCGTNVRRMHAAGQAGRGSIAPAPAATAAVRCNTGGGPLPSGQFPHRPPIRVMRLIDAGQSANQGGRMVISGRMADVCAELDRMVAHEAAQRY